MRWRRNGKKAAFNLLTKTILRECQEKCVSNFLGSMSNFGVYPI